LIVLNYRPRPHPDTITRKDGPPGGTAERSCTTNIVTPVKVLQERTVLVQPFYTVLDKAGDYFQELKHLLLSLDFKRGTRDGSCSSRFTMCLAEAGAEPHQGMALRFLSSIFHDTGRDILQTLNPEAGRHSKDQVTIFILADTNVGQNEVLALAHIKLFPNVGILVKWLAVTGANISHQKYGLKADGGSWRKRGLSSILLIIALEIAEQIGKSLHKAPTFPSIFAEVRGDNVDAHAFYNKKGFVKVNKFPACVEKDLLKNYVSTNPCEGGGAMFIEDEAESSLQRMELNFQNPSVRRKGTRVRKNQMNSGAVVRRKK
jgi:GNAT superfamily N-acetyltransferase